MLIKKIIFGGIITLLAILLKKQLEKEDKK